MHVRRLISTGVLVSMVVITSNPSDVGAQSQAGGLPAVSERVSVLERLAVTLQTAVTSLQTQVTVLQTANNDLKKALDAEAAARTAADNALRAALDQEASTRETADTNLSLALVTERLQRIGTDEELRGLISNARGQAFSTFRNHASLINGATALVGKVGPLPAGNYLIIAKATVLNFDNNAVWDCFLRRDDGVSVDSTSTGTAAHEFLDDLGPDHSNIVNVGLTSMPAPGSVNMFCGSREAGSEIFNIAMTAVQVGQATIACPDLAFRCPGDE